MRGGGWRTTSWLGKGGGRIDPQQRLVRALAAPWVEMAIRSTAVSGGEAGEGRGGGGGRGRGGRGGEGRSSEQPREGEARLGAVE